MAYDNNSSSLGGIGAAIKLAIDKNKLAGHLQAHQAVSLWPEVAGEQIGSVTQAEAVRGRVLFVQAKSSVWANELTFYKPDLLEKLNSRLGGKILDDINFSTGNRTSASSPSRKEARTYKKHQAPDFSQIAPSIPLALDPDDPTVKLGALVARTKAVIAWKRENGWIPCTRCQALYEPAPSPKPKPRGRGKKDPTAGYCPVCRTLTQR